MFSKTNPWKGSALRLAGLALVASAVIAAPLSAESKKGSKGRSESPATWAGGAGSVLFAVVGSGKKGGGAPLAAGGGQAPSAANSPAPASTLNATNCTTIWHGKVIPCNGFSP